MVNYTYKYRIYPNETQQVLLNKHFGCVRFIYNHFLNQRVDAYMNQQKTLNYYDNAASLTELKKELVWLKEVNSQSLQFSLKCLEGAYGKFFTRSAKFPRFKSKKSKQSFCVPQHGKIENNLLFIGKFKKGIKIVIDRPIVGEIKHITVSKNPSGQHFACVCVEREINKLPPKTKVVGIDLGIKTLVVQSDGKTYANIRPYKTLEKQLAKLQQWFSRTTKGTNLHEKLRKKVAKLHQRISNIRNDHLQKVSWQIVKNNGVIVLEDLNVKGMMKNHCLAKSIADVGLSELIRMIKYKAEWYGRTVIQIDRWFPSSKTCNKCNYVKQDLTLEDREWICPRCEVKHDRDLNAAKNIRKQGITTAGIAGLAWGAEVRPKCDETFVLRHSALKQETPTL
jgi:putative transposase